jgi:hypothetical protein
MSVSNSDIQFYTTGPAQGAVTTSSTGGYFSNAEVVFDSLFDDLLNDQLKQYRCIAVCNTNVTYTASNVSVYLKSPSENPNCVVQIAVERPYQDAWISTATSGTTLSLVDSTFSSDDTMLFVGSMLEFISGTNVGVIRQVAAYDPDTKTVSFVNSLAATVSLGDRYVIHPAPSLRMPNGTISPGFNVIRRSALSVPLTSTSAISINVSNRGHQANLHPYDVIYVWFERSLTKNSSRFDNNSITLALRYSQ